MAATVSWMAVRDQIVSWSCWSISISRTTLLRHAVRGPSWRQLPRHHLDVEPFVANAGIVVQQRLHYCDERIRNHSVDRREHGLKHLTLRRKGEEQDREVHPGEN